MSQEERKITSGRAHLERLQSLRNGGTPDEIATALDEALGHLGSGVTDEHHPDISALVDELAPRRSLAQPSNGSALMAQLTANAGSDGAFEIPIKKHKVEEHEPQNPPEHGLDEAEANRFTKLVGINKGQGRKL